jgi:hypothetical protein
MSILLGMLALLINGKAPKASIALLLCAGISFVVNMGISGFHIGSSFLLLAGVISKMPPMGSLSKAGPLVWFIYSLAE